MRRNSRTWRIEFVLISLVLAFIGLGGCGDLGDAFRVGEVQRRPTAKNTRPDGGMRDCNVSPQSNPPFPSEPSGSRWDHATQKNKQNMMQEIFPRMQAMFQRYAPERFGAEGSFHCQTCHGKPISSKEPFTSPSVLYPLDPRNLPSQQDPDPHIAKAVKFMEREVMPQMEMALGKKLTCFSCHATKQQMLSQEKQNTRQETPRKNTEHLRHAGMRAPSSLFLCPPNHARYEDTCLRTCISECAVGFECKQAGERRLCFQIIR